MKIVNKTHWRTAHLRAFIQRVALDEIEVPARKALQVTVKYNRQKDQGSCSGRASLTRPVITVMVPSQVVDRVDLAHTIAHELAHMRGMKHHQMNRNPQYYRIGNWRERYAWAETMPLERSTPKTRPKGDVQMQRYQRALASEKRWRTRLKRAQTALKKLRPKLRYYERILTAAGKLPKTGGER
jgi:hypothetical protein